LGVNNVLAIHSAREPGRIDHLTWRSLALGTPVGVVLAAAGWFLLPALIPADDPEVLRSSRLYLVYVPVFILTAYLMAIDQGAGLFDRFNATRNVLNPVYLVAVVILWALGRREAVWFLMALLLANVATLAYRLSFVSRPPQGIGQPSASPAALVREGFPFWVTGLGYVVRDNIEKFILLMLLGPVGLGLYVVAWTASSSHLTLSKSLNFVVFSRAAALSQDDASRDVARVFRIMFFVNGSLGLVILLMMPWLIRLLYGPPFTTAVYPAIVLIASQVLLSQASILDEGLRGQGRPIPGLLGLLAATTIFCITAPMLAPRLGVVGIAVASASAQLGFLVWMVVVLKRRLPGVSLMCRRADIREAIRAARTMANEVVAQLAARRKSMNAA
jgi:O-antigen/teichoic acid export membrane protein